MSALAATLVLRRADPVAMGAFILPVFNDFESSARINSARVAVCSSKSNPWPES
jgi:hypothetical protein